MFKWLHEFRDFHKNEKFGKIYDKKKLKIKKPTDEILHQSSPLRVVTHPYMLKKWMALYAMAANKSFADLLVESHTSADLLRMSKSREIKKKAENVDESLTESQAVIIEEFETNTL